MYYYVMRYDVCIVDMYLKGLRGVIVVCVT